MWYPAREDAPALPFPSVIQSRTNFPDQSWDVSGVGEVYDAPRVRNHERRKLGARGLHVCGTAADFAGRATYDPDAVPVAFDADGLPVCCGAAQPLQGGAESGGEIEASYAQPGPIPGTSCATAGEIEIGTEYVWTSAGEVDAWFRAPAVPNEQYHLTAECHPTFATISAFSGFNCGLGLHGQFFLIASGCLPFVPDNTGFFVWLRFQLTEVGEVYTFKIDTGFCP